MYVEPAENYPVEPSPVETPYSPSPEQAKQLYEMGQLDAPTALKLGARVDPAFVDATIQAESSGRAGVSGPITKSGERAQGLMQVMPATGAEVAQQLGMQSYDLKNPEDNKAIGTEYLAQQMDKYKDPILASAAYNAGPGRVDDAIAQAGTNDPNKVMPLLPKETQNYVPKVMKGYLDRVAGSQAPEQSDYAANPAIPSSAVDSIKNQAPSAQVLGVTSSVPSPHGSAPDPFTMKSEAIERSASVGEQRAIEEASFMRARADQQEKLLIEQQQKEAQRQTQIKEQEQKAQQALDEFSKTKVDPDRFWKSKSTGEKIIAGIAIALGALGQGLSKGTIQSNGALDIINGAINRDIEAQKMEILSKKETADGAKGILAQMRERFDDERVAENMTRVISLDQAKLKLEEIASKSKSGEVAANKDLLLAQIEEDRQKNLLEVQKAINESPQAQATKRDMVVFGKQNPANNKTQKASPEILSEKDRERYVPGLGMAITKEDAEKLKTAQEDFAKFNNLLNEMVESRKKYGAELFGAEAEKQKARSMEALLSIKNVEKMGALDSAAIKVGGRIIPEDPSEFRWTGDPVSELQEVQRRARLSYNEKIKSKLSMVSPEAEKQLKTTGSISSFTPKGAPKG